MAKLRHIVGERILALRKAQGLSQSDLAAKARLSLTFVGAVERAQKAATLDTLERLARALDVDAGALVERGTRKVAHANPDPVTRIVAQLRGQPPHKLDLVERVLHELFRPTKKLSRLGQGRAALLSSARKRKYGPARTL